MFGGIQFCAYRKYGAPLERRFQPNSCLYRTQVFFSIVLGLLSVVCIILQVTGVIKLKTVDGVEYTTSPMYVYMILSAVFSAVVWPLSLVLLRLERKQILPTIPTRGHGMVLLMFWSLAFATENMAFISWWSSQWWWDLKSTSEDVEFGLWVSRYILTAFMFFIGLRAPGLSRRRYGLMINEDGEAIYEEEEETSASHQSTWSNFWKKIKLLWPYMWPKKKLSLQFRVIFCFLVLLTGRGVNLLVPILYKLIVDDLTKRRFCYDYILYYVGLKFLQGGSMGLLNNLRTFLWIRIQQYSTKEIEVQLFKHLHGLSLRWHLSRKTGEVLRVMDRGTTSINSLLNYIVFSILPTIADIIIAVIYFISAFNGWFGLIVFVTMVLYLVATIAVTEWRTKYRRQMNLNDNERNAKGVDSLLNFETVKYYGAADFEVNRYSEAIDKYQDAEWIAMASLSLLNSIQNIIIISGLLGGSLLCAWFIYEGNLTVGDYVLFSSYVIQLYAPLNWFGTYYRMIQQNFIDMENMFDLLKEEQEVKDIEDSVSLEVRKGLIEFDHVNFHYDPSKPILKDITFIVPPGQTYALVGHSGSGKSTIIRLLFRFYDIQSGAIRIDGQDIKKVQQESLRKTIGVVPQDTVLFNNDIRYNIRYGRVTATESEVEDAAKAADIHERIQTFPDGYKTLVGERGLKLSGGEKQRVAIARTLLKAPAFVLLDEATSALDTQTERNIQASLGKVCENRTTIIVAHRLSTIIHADQILVMNEGQIVERGTHEDLLDKNGAYAAMWQQQQQKADDEDEGTASGGSDEDKKSN